MTVELGESHLWANHTWWVCFELLFAEVIAVVVVVVIIALVVEAKSALSSSTGPGTSDSKEAS